MNSAKNICRLLLIVTIVTFSGCQKFYRLETGKLIVEFGSRGKLHGLKNKDTGIDYLSKKGASYLLSLRIDGRFYEPTSISITDDIFLLNYGEPGITAKIKAETKKSYLTFELLELSDM